MDKPTVIGELSKINYLAEEATKEVKKDISDVSIIREHIRLMTVSITDILVTLDND